MTAARLPDAVPENTVIVDVTAGRRDSFGRVRFLAFWAEDIRWRGGGLVVGQAFYASLAEFVCRAVSDGRAVQITGADVS
jgi:hypothetical protein